MFGRRRTLGAVSGDSGGSDKPGEAERLARDSAVPGAPAPGGDRPAHGVDGGHRRHHAARGPGDGRHRDRRGNGHDGELEAVATPEATTGAVAPVLEPVRRRRWRRFPKPPGGHRTFLVFGGLVLLAALAVGVHYYLQGIAWESTDDAFIEGRIVQVGPKVAGQVLRVLIDDNQAVRRGDVLVEIDPRDFEARVAQARANLAAAQSRLEGARLGVDVMRATAGGGLEQAASAVQTAEAQEGAARDRLAQANAEVQMANANAEQARAAAAAAEAEASRAGADALRYEELAPQGSVSRQELERAQATAKSATAVLEAARKRVAAVDAQVTQARAAVQVATQSLRQAGSQVAEAAGRHTAAKAAPDQVAATRAQVQTSEAEIAQMRAALDLAELQLTYTRVTAPVDGRVTKRTVEAGSYVQVGQALLALVPAEFWVVANFKETQLGRMRPGQTVEIRVDTYPDRRFRGRVDSIQSGAGARFSLLPPENASGNYVKVVQRVPVKIVFDEPTDPSHPLGPGMSVVPSVRVRP
jgi:membrane fusion protein, multidrug efflux system